MKILVIDQDFCGLPFSMAAQEDGHSVRLWNPHSTPIGDGIISKVPTWQPHMKWADMIVLTDNSKTLWQLQPYFDQHYPIFGSNKHAAQLELDREMGQKALEMCGIQTLPFEVFESFDKAIKYVEQKNRPFVCKPWGGDPDKSLSYVPKKPADLLVRLERWKKDGKLKGKFMLQQMVTGVEMAVGGWIGPGGWAPWYNENWEEKRLMPDGLGPNTGEMGTVMRYTKDSRLFDLVLKPVAGLLMQLGYVGYVDMNCIIDEHGTPWPLEFTMRFGWPHFNLCMTLHEGDTAEWMLDLLHGKSTLECSTDVCVGAVMAFPDFPYNKRPEEQSVGYPINGVLAKDSRSLRLSSVMRGPGIVASGTKRDTWLTAGTYVAIATGTGSTIERARKACYEQADRVTWANDKIMRKDIGCRLEKTLPQLQRQGFATGLKYGG